jgi:hypothetical protein
VRWDGVSVVDLATGTVEDRRLPEYGAGDVQFKLVRIAERLIFRGSRGRRYGTFSIDAGLEGEAEYVGRSWYFVPSATPGRIWLTTLDRRPRESGGLLRSVREVDLSGAVTARARARLPDRWLVGALPSGLVFQGDEHLRVWDPRTGRVVARLPVAYVVAQSGDTIVSCGATCPSLLVTEVGAGESRRILAPSGWVFEGTYDGSFSPDGELIAAAVTKGALSRLALVDIEGGGATIVPSARLDPGFGVSTWSGSAEWVIFNSGHGRLTAYELASGDIRTFELGADHVVMALVRGD